MLPAGELPSAPTHPERPSTFRTFQRSHFDLPDSLMGQVVNSAAKTQKAQTARNDEETSCRVLRIYTASKKTTTLLRVPPHSTVSLSERTQRQNSGPIGSTQIRKWYQRMMIGHASPDGSAEISMRSSSLCSQRATYSATPSASRPRSAHSQTTPMRQLRSASCSITNWSCSMVVWNFGCQKSLFVAGVIVD